MGKIDFTGADGKCQLCDKNGHSFIIEIGNNEGDGGKLGDNMLPDRSKHQMYAGVNSLEAHHIIVSESMRGDNNPWATFVNICGYDINHPKNGVFLTKRRDVACKLATPLHDGNHDQGETLDHRSYSTLVMDRVQEVAEDIVEGDYCSNPKGIRERLDNLSQEILQKISDFDYALTKNGKNYKAGNKGCGCGSRQHNIMGLPKSAEYWVRTNLPTTEDEKIELMEMFKEDYSLGYLVKRKHPLKVGE